MKHVDEIRVYYAEEKEVKELSVKPGLKTFPLNLSVGLRNAKLPTSVGA